MVPRWRLFGDFLSPVFLSNPHAVHFRPAFKIRTKATPCVEVWKTSNLQPLRLGEEEKNKRKKRKKQDKTRMWGNAQHDDCPAEYRWRPLFNAAKFGSRPLLECHAVMLPRRETRLNLPGCPKLANRSQLLVGQSSPYCGDTCRRYCCLTSFFRLSIHALVAKI